MIKDLAEIFENYQFYRDEAAKVPLRTPISGLLHARDNYLQFCEAPFKDNPEQAAIELERALQRAPHIEDKRLYAYAAATCSYVARKHGLTPPAWTEDIPPLPLEDCLFMNPCLSHIFDEFPEDYRGEVSDLFRDFGCFVKNNHMSYC